MRKMTKGMVILFGFVLLLCASSLHVTKGVRIAEAVTKTAPQRASLSNRLILYLSILLNT